MQIILYVLQHKFFAIFWILWLVCNMAICYKQKVAAVNLNDSDSVY